MRPHAKLRAVPGNVQEHCSRHARHFLQSRHQKCGACPASLTAVWTWILTFDAGSVHSPCRCPAHEPDNPTPPHPHETHTKFITSSTRCKSAPAHDACRHKTMPPHTTHTLRRLATAHSTLSRCCACAWWCSPAATHPASAPAQAAAHQGLRSEALPEAHKHGPLPCVAVSGVLQPHRASAPRPGCRLPGSALRSAPQSAQTRSPSQRCGPWHTPAAPRPASGPRPGCRPRRRAGNIP